MTGFRREGSRPAKRTLRVRPATRSGRVPTYHPCPVCGTEFYKVNDARKHCNVPKRDKG